MDSIELLLFSWIVLVAACTGLGSTKGRAIEGMAVGALLGILVVLCPIFFGQLGLFLGVAAWAGGLLVCACMEPSEREQAKRQLRIKREIERLELHG